MTAFLLGAAAGFRLLPAWGLMQCAAARRVPPRLAGNFGTPKLRFHLLAQMKVTKAKGLEHQPFEWFASATRLLQRLWHENIQRTTLSVTSLTFSRSSSFRLDPAGPRRGGMRMSLPTATGRAEGRTP